MQNKLTLEAFADWCESKPPDEIYIWDDVGVCACAQYAKYLGIDYWWMSSSAFWSNADQKAHYSYGHTFGQLTKDLRAAT